jgi:hypothetical protein
LGHACGRSNAHAPDKKKSFCFFFFRKRSSCLPVDLLKIRKIS